MFCRTIDVENGSKRRSGNNSSAGSLHSNSTKQVSNSNINSQSHSHSQIDASNRMSSDYGCSMNLPPQNQALSTLTLDAAITESYNNGNGFAPMASSTRGSSLLQQGKSNGTAINTATATTPPRKSSYRTDGANGGESAGRSCLVVPSFGSGKKKKKTKNNRSSPKRGLFGRSSTPSSGASTSTSAESSTVDPYQINDNHNDQQSLLKSFNSYSSSKKSGHARDWYLETMLEEGDENVDQEYSNGHNYSNNNSNNKSNGRPSQFQAQQQQQQQPLYSQFQQPQRRINNNEQHESSGSASSAVALPSLLKLPTAEDRSHEARSQHNKMHAYQGEMEPEGIRGQEATVVTGTTASNSRSTPSSEQRRPKYLQDQQEQQQQKTPPQFSITKHQPMLAMRDFTNSSTSETSSQLLPIRQVVSNRQRQIRDSLLLSTEEQDEEENEVEYDDHLDYLAKQSPLKPPPNTQGNRMTLASAALNTNSISQENDDEHYDDDEHDDMISRNLEEIDREYQHQDDDSNRSQSHSQSHSQSQRSRILQQQQQKERDLQAIFANEQANNANANNAPTTPTPTNGNGVEGQQSMSPTPSKAYRRSAPVNIDDSSFEDPLEHIQGIHAMAMEHVMQGEFDMALQAFTQVLEVYIQEHGQSHPLTASAHHNLGTVHTKRAGLLPEHTLHQRHCREQALKCFQAAARSARDCPTLGPSHPNVAVSLVRIGFLLLQSRQYRNAVITFEEALRIRTDNYGPTHGLVANLYNNLGVCHMHLQHFPEGRKYLQQALDIQKELLGQEEDYSSTSLLELADTLCNIGGLNLEWIRRQGPDARHASDAELAFLEALELRSKVLGEEHALTNQVRSLHDMVRSIPMPKNIAPSRNTPSTPVNANRRPSWSSAHSSIPGKMNAYGCEYSPAAVSDITTSVAQTPTAVKHLTMQTNNEKSILSTSTKSADMSADEINTSGLSMPVLKLPEGESLLPNGSGSGNIVNNNANAMLMDGYDVTEESCLLRKPADDNQSGSQTGGFVTYAQSTASVGSGNNAALNNESDRMKTIRHAKAVLDSHKNFMDSPNRKGVESDSPSRTEKTIDERDGNVNEDGVVPLAGDWPGPRNNARLSPDCLQNPSQNLHTIHNCAATYMAEGRQTEAVTLLEMVVECQKAKNGPLHEDVGSAVHNVGVAYLRMEEHYDAFQAFEEAVRVRKGALGREHPEVAVSLVKFGITLMLLQRHEDSLWIFREALSIRKQALGDLHPSNARICNNIGCVHVELGELQEARKAFESALDIQRNALIRNPENGPMIFGASTTLQNLGYLYGKRDMYEKAAMVLRESLSLQERIMYPEHPTVLITLASLAETCLDARRFSHALKYYRQLFNRSQSMESVDCLKQAATLQTIATIYSHLDDPKAQKKKLEMALRFVRSDNGSKAGESSKIQKERRALEKKIQGELELMQGDLLSKEDDGV